MASIRLSGLQRPRRFPPDILRTRRLRALFGKYVAFDQMKVVGDARFREVVFTGQAEFLFMVVKGRADLHGLVFERVGHMGTSLKLIG
ncbi:hypothetical protein [Streptomyces sp. NPDC046727]|uniref:hypothetical protein n=1 Tax=Streptomyces sp. NPDC046727 TaxID=3155373 RepID=UPI0033E96B24